MQKIILGLCMVLWIAAHAETESAVRVAVLRCENAAEGAQTWDSWNLASQLAKELERGKKIQAVDRKKVKGVAEKVEWDDHRMTESGEQSLRAIGADYALYCQVKEWREALRSITQPLAVYVAFRFVLVDLRKEEQVMDFAAPGNATNTAEQDRPGLNTSVLDQPDLEPLFREAYEAAFRKAAAQIQRAALSSR